MKHWSAVAILLLGCSAPTPSADAGSSPPDATFLPDAAAADVIVDAVVADASGDAPAADADASVHVCATTAQQDCSPGTGTGEGDQCHDGPSCFVTKVQKAVNDVVAQNPTWFDFDNQWSCPQILDVDSYMDAVVAKLTSGGLCAIRDPNAPGEEVTVKHDNAFTENFDIVASTGCARSGSAIYTGWCAPAWW